MDIAQTGSRCAIHTNCSTDITCLQCIEDWTCKECDEVRYNDPKVEQGMQCFVCTYANKGGE
jgi:hypothetical protein